MQTCSGNTQNILVTTGNTYSISGAIGGGAKLQIDNSSNLGTVILSATNSTYTGGTFLPGNSNGLVGDPSTMTIGQTLIAMSGGSLGNATSTITLGNGTVLEGGASFTSESSLSPSTSPRRAAVTNP